MPTRERQGFLGQAFAIATGFSPLTDPITSRLVFPHPLCEMVVTYVTAPPGIV